MKKYLLLAALTLGSIATVSYIAYAATAYGPFMPVADGTYQSWFPQGSASHYRNVDDLPCNGLSDYNVTTIVGARDAYRIDLSSIPDGTWIDAIVITPCAGYVPRGASTSLPIMNVFYTLDGSFGGDFGNYRPNSLVPTQLASTTISTGFMKTATTTIEIGAVYSGPSLPGSLAGVRLSNIGAVLVSF